MLFIVVHQAYELWFKQILHELGSVIALFRARLGGRAQRRRRAGPPRARGAEIQKILIDQLRVLETMTPLDFLEFRDFLVPASGFQSLQFRLIENQLGLRARPALPREDRRRPRRPTQRVSAEAEPSLFDLVERWLERTPFLELPGFQFWEQYGRR